MIPLEAVISFAGVTKVFIVEGDTVHARAVKWVAFKTEGRRFWRA